MVFGMIPLMNPLIWYSFLGQSLSNLMEIDGFYQQGPKSSKKISESIAETGA